MSRAMHRYEVPIDDEPHAILLTAGPASVAIAPDGRFGLLVEFWAERDDAKPEAVRAFQVYGTGHQLPDGAKHVGTCPRTSGLVFHLYELAP